RWISRLAWQRSPIRRWFYAAPSTRRRRRRWRASWRRAFPARATRRFQAPATARCSSSRQRWRRKSTTQYGEFVRRDAPVAIAVDGGPVRVAPVPGPELFVAQVAIAVPVQLAKQPLRFGRIPSVLDGTARSRRGHFLLGLGGRLIGFLDGLRDRCR